jgi:hypothetical protein
MRDRDQKGRRVVFRGEDNVLAKLSTADVLLIKQLRLNGQSCRSLGRQFNVCHQLISKLVNGKTRQYLLVR